MSSKLAKKGPQNLPTKFAHEICLLSKKNCPKFTSHSAYVATSTESHGVKIDGFLYPNFM